MIKLLVIPLFFHVIFAYAGENPGSSKKQSLPPNKIAANCNPGIAFTDLFINNVRAGLLTGGDTWWDLNNQKYEVPAGSGKHSLFAGSLWFSGYDAGGQLLVAAQTYRQTGTDYWPGAVDTTTVDIDATRCLYYDNHWKVNRQEVVDFVAGGTATPDIMSWPGNGSAIENEGHFLAPFVDANADGIYNYLDGDYPGFNLSSPFPTIPGTTIPLCENYLLGDQSVWWVINDVGNIKTESGSLPIGLEIHCQAFAYQSTLPSVNHATFYKYKVINRSSQTFSNMYFGQWVDPDLGHGPDDYVGCDVIRGLGYCYNGDMYDDTPSGYGTDPPAVGVDFLKGPVADMQDGIDNDRDGCTDCTFIDSAGTTIVLSELILPETISMSKFMTYDNVNGSPTGNPNGFSDFNNYLNSIWLDGQPLTYGGNGRDPSAPVCNFMYPGTTDPAFITDWTEVSAGNAPNDRRFIQSAGTFSMEPGEVNYITTAVVWARQSGGGPMGSLALLQQYDSEIQQLFTQCYDFTGVGLSEAELNHLIKIYPNPAIDEIVIDMSLPPGSRPQIDLFNTKGEKVITAQPGNASFYRMSVKELAAGNYFCRVSIDGKSHFSSKVLVIKP